MQHAVHIRAKFVLDTFIVIEAPAPEDALRKAYELTEQDLMHKSRWHINGGSDVRLTPNDVEMGFDRVMIASLLPEI